MYLLMLVPFVNMVAWLGIMVFLGLKGRELAATSQTFTSRDQYVGFMKAIDHAGKVIFFAALGVIVIAFTIAAVARTFL
jgi:hypothetical protein